MKALVSLKSKPMRRPIPCLNPMCRALRAETYRQMDCPQMLVGPLEGAFLKVLTQIVRATHVLEIGMFTGYSASASPKPSPRGYRDHL